MGEGEGVNYINDIIYYQISIIKPLNLIVGDIDLTQKE